MRLYHYTSADHLPSIRRDGVLRTTESNVSLTQPHAGPDVVWLTTDPRPRAGTHGLAGLLDKTAVQITVDVDGERWMDSDLFAAMDDLTRRAIVTAGGGDKSARTWWICREEIPREAWIDLRVNGIRAPMIEEER